MKTLINSLSFVAATTILLMSGCSKHENHGTEKASGHGHSMHSMSGTTESVEGHDHSMHEMEAASAGPAGPVGAGGLVEVPKGGKKFEPPLVPAQVPIGAWYCDMNGSVHYARGDQGDGECPLCHMKLLLRR